MGHQAERVQRMGRSRGAGLAWVSLGVLLALGIGVAAITAQADAQPVYSTYAERLRLPPRVMPAEPVPQLFDLWSQSFLDPKVDGVTFYSTNRPLVAVSVGDEDPWRVVMGFSEVLRRERVVPYLVTVRVRNPGSAKGLGPDLLRYWKSVPLVAVTADPSSHPAWMDEGSAYAR